MSQLEYTCSTGRRVPVELRRRKGMRHLRLSLNLRNSIVLSLPWHCSKRVGEKFLEQNREWLEQQISTVPDAIGLEDWLQRSPQLTAAGLQFQVAVERLTVSRPSYKVNREENRLVFRLPLGADGGALFKLVRKFAKDVLTARADELAARHDLSFSSLSVRNQSSRWGSCSLKRAISLNWRLVLLEPGLQDYIILHELAHLKEMNHSKKFWELLDSYDPKRQQHEVALEAITAEVMRVRAAIL